MSWYTYPLVYFAKRGRQYLAEALQTLRGVLHLDTANELFLLKVAKERLQSAPGFDKDDWPDMADPTRQNTIHSYYGTENYNRPTDSPDTPYEGDNPYIEPPVK